MDFKKIKRIAIIGSPGSGKSTMAKKLGEITGFEYFHLDKHYHNAGWVPKPKEEFTKIVSELVLKEEWIMDGNYRGTLDLRANRAGLIIILLSSAFTEFIKEFLNQNLDVRKEQISPKTVTKNGFRSNLQSGHGIIIKTVCLILTGY